jgi:ubiquinone/menaquinone biosynthesis C-methylase UbiE
MNEIEKCWIDHAKASEIDDVTFQNWFNLCASIDDCVCNGYMDFFHRIFTPDMYECAGNPRNKTCLEVGCGGGRLLNAACTLFANGYGIDILDESSFKKTDSFLHKNGRNNFTLLHKDHLSSIQDESIDFVYSFIVFQHFSSEDEIKAYFKFFDRVLKRDGCGKVFFGRCDTPNKDVDLRKDSFNRQIFDYTLLVSKKYALDIVNENFTVLDTGTGTKRLWNKDVSNQFYVKFKRK